MTSSGRMCTMNRSLARAKVDSTSRYNGAFGALRCANGCRGTVSTSAFSLRWSVVTAPILADRPDTLGHRRTLASVRAPAGRHDRVHRQRDTLFPGGVGKTLTPENFTSLVNDVSSRIFDKLPDDTWFYPGHGDDSTLGAERPKLDEWRERGW